MALRQALAERGFSWVSQQPAEPAPTGGPADVIVSLIYDRRAAARK
jgi:hypothetical protein